MIAAILTWNGMMPDESCIMEMCSISPCSSFPAPGHDKCADREYHRKERNRLRLSSRRGGGRSRRGDGAGVLFIENVRVGDGE